MAEDNGDFGIRKVEKFSSQLPPGVVVLVGPPGTYKTTAALSWPGVIKIYDFDIGVHRAWKIREKMADGLVHVVQVPVPKKSISTRWAKLEGFKETWRSFSDDFLESCEDSEVSTIVIDTGTLEWAMCCDAYLQELQEDQLTKAPNTPDSRLRKRLIQIEYGEPNSRQTSLFHAAKGYGKWLVFVTHEADEYVPVLNPNTKEPALDDSGNQVFASNGKKKPDGFKRTVGMADWMFWFREEEVENDGIKSGKYITTIGKSGWGSDLMYMDIEDFELSKLEDRLKTLGRL
jgi:hypothetical protein